MITRGDGPIGYWLVLVARVMQRCWTMKSPIPPNWDVPQLFRDRVGATLGRQRMMHEGGHLLLILHELPKPEAPGARVAQLFWRNPDGNWKSTGGKGSTAVVLREHQQAFAELAEQLEAKVEQATTAAEFFAILQSATPTLRTSRNAYRALQEAREAIPTDRELISARDFAHDLERAFELLKGYAQDGLEFVEARNAEEGARNTERVNQSSYRLNMLMALFLPITALGSLFGMNLRHGIEDWYAPNTFWIVSGLSFGLGFWIRARLPKPDHK